MTIQTKSTISENSLSLIQELNNLIVTSAEGIRQAGDIVYRLIKGGVKKETIVGYSGYLNKNDIETLFLVGKGQVNPSLFLVSGPAAHHLKKAPMRIQEGVLSNGATIYDAEENKAVNLPVAKLTNKQCKQLFTRNYTMRSVAEQRKYVNSYQEPVQAPAYTIDDDVITFNRKCSFTKSQIKQLIKNWN